MTIKDHDEPAAVPVWDGPTRVYHWGQALLVALALLTGFLIPTDWLNIHVVIGTLIAMLLVFRLVWGLCGSEYSRFTNFIYHPRRVLEHIASVLKRAPEPHLGHNPAGAVMVTLLMLALAGMIASGYIMLGGAYKEGPLATLFSFATGERAGGLHSLLAYGLIGLVTLHLLGVWIESRIGGENLIRAMIDGVKRRTAAATPPRPRQPRPLTAGLALTGIAYLIAVGLVWSLRQPPAVPRLPLDPTYKAECGGCHWAYHPSLLPAASWNRLMAGLEDHFGEDAGLKPERAAAIAGWLAAHSAESWDTLPAHRLSVLDPAQPLRITATPFWKRRHSHIPPAVLKSIKGGAGACNVCHTDADSGRFNFRRIDRSHRQQQPPSPPLPSSPKGTP